MIDDRCFKHDHWFPWDELYDEDGNVCANQLDVKCNRCGITLRGSLEAVMSEARLLMELHAPKTQD